MRSEIANVAARPSRTTKKMKEINTGEFIGEFACGRGEEIERNHSDFAGFWFGTFPCSQWSLSPGRRRQGGLHTSEKEKKKKDNVGLL
jgi:hypothetical protein